MLSIDIQADNGELSPSELIELDLSSYELRDLF